MQAVAGRHQPSRMHRRHALKHRITEIAHIHSCGIAVNECAQLAPPRSEIRCVLPFEKPTFLMLTLNLLLESMSKRYVVYFIIDSAHRERVLDGVGGVALQAHNVDCVFRAYTAGENSEPVERLQANKAVAGTFNGN